MRQPAKMRYISFDADRCVGCQICQLVCSGTWQRVFNPLKANLRIEPTGWYDRFRAHVCRQRDDAECVEVCPTGALFVDEKRGVVRLDKERCNGCRQCMDVCPYGAIFMHPDNEHVFKCDLCGGGMVQQCVLACPRNALSVKEAGA